MSDPEVRRLMLMELKRSWRGMVFVLVLIVTAFICFCLGVGSAYGDFKYCGHGYISNGTVKDVYKSSYFEERNQTHHHIYKTYLHVPDYGWIYAHKHDRVC